MAKKTATKKTRGKRKGRPPGATNKTIRTVTLERTTCPRCGSVERVPYYNIRRSRIAGHTLAGRIYEGITWRRTRCTDCDQHRDDREFHYIK